MPESTCLHIQERESGPIRVVEIPWISVRIGRASHCEVRLPDHDLAEEVCRLHRRGRSWHLVPASSRSPISLEGRPVDGPCLLAFDVPFRVGHYCLTLRHDRAAEPDWGMYSGPVPRQLDRVTLALEAGHSAKDERDRPQPYGGSQPVIEPLADPAPEPGARPLIEAQGIGPNSESVRTVNVRERWETRWRVAGAQLKARSERSQGVPESMKPSLLAGFDSVPLKEPQVPRVPPGVPASIEPALHPIPAPGVKRAEPAWTGPTTEPLETGSTAHRRWTEWNARKEPVAAPRCRLPRAGTEDSPTTSLPTDQLPTATGRIEPSPESSIPKDPAPIATGKVEPIAETSLPTDQPLTATGKIEPPPQKTVVDERAELSSDPAVNRVEWPSATDILAAHRATSQSRATVPTGRLSTRQRNGSQALPTVGRPPAHWNMPVWLAGPPAAVLVLVAGLAGCVLSWWWACDTYSASIMTERLVTTDRSAQRRPLPESVGPPSGTWTQSTSQHLAHWAIFLSRFEGGKDHSPQEIPALLERALQVSPINPTARLAMAQLEPLGTSTTVSIRSLGLSRDVVSLAWSAHRLLAAGEKEAALKMYGQSLSVAISAESSRAGLARFSEDPSVPRYLLPGEERVRAIVRELAFRNEWTFPEWSVVLPDSAMVRLAAARLLREQGRSEAEALLDSVLDERRTAAAPFTVDPLTLAARAEAFALRSRWREAGAQYRQAIELIDDDTIKRSWWFNLADIALRLDDDNQLQAALRAALAVATSDDITRRATEIQRATRARSTLRSTGVRAN